MRYQDAGQESGRGRGELRREGAGWFDIGGWG